jgi:hypothetical protein
MAAERRALVATHSEPDQGMVEAAVSEAEEYLGNQSAASYGLGLGRPSNIPGSSLTRRQHAEAQFQPRPLFVIAEFDVAGKPIYQAIVGSPRDPEGWFYADALTVVEDEGQYRIVGRAGVDAFGPTDPLDWEPLGGVQVDTSNPPVRITALRRPRDADHAAAHDRLVASATEQSHG